MTETYSKTKTSFYRRLYLAYLIESGVNTPKALMAATDMPRRTLQDTLKALAELDIECQSLGGTKAMSYQITNWGAINKDWIADNLDQLKAVLDYP